MDIKKNKEIFSLANSIVLILPSKIRFSLVFTVVLAILSAIFDSISTLSIIPALTLIFNPEKINTANFYNLSLVNTLNLSETQLVIFVFSMVLMLTFIANGLKILFIRFSSYISAQIVHILELKFIIIT